MTTCAVGDLAPEARAALDDYLAAVGATLDDDLRGAVLCDLRTWMLDHLGPSATAADPSVAARSDAAARGLGTHASGAPSRPQWSGRTTGSDRPRTA